MGLCIYLYYFFHFARLNFLTIFCSERTFSSWVKCHKIPLYIYFLGLEFLKALHFYLQSSLATAKISQTNPIFIPLNSAFSFSFL